MKYLDLEVRIGYTAYSARYRAGPSYRVVSTFAEDEPAREGGDESRVEVISLIKLFYTSERHTMSTIVMSSMPSVASLSPSRRTCPRVLFPSLSKSSEKPLSQELLLPEYPGAPEGGIYEREANGVPCEMVEDAETEAGREYCGCTCGDGCLICC